MSHVTYSGNVLTIDGTNVQCAYEIIDAFEANGVVIVFLDPDANMGNTMQYRNLIAYGLSGKKLWEAELPTKKISDVYWKLANREPLKVYSFSSHECEIDPVTGKILNSNFYK